MSDDFKSKLAARGKRQDGTHDCWQKGDDKADWGQPFSMAPTGKVTSKGYPVKKFDESVPKWIDGFQQQLQELEMASNYVIWKYKSEDGACVLQDLRGIEQSFRLNNGTRLASDFPAEVTLHMHPDFPDDILLVDNLLNRDQLIVASARLKNLLAAQGLANVEYLPVSIINHRERVASKDYFIIHPVDPIECVDENLSEYRMSRVDPDSIRSFSALALDENRIPAERALFRLKRFWDITLVRRDVASAITAAGFTGVDWLELLSYPED